MKSSAVKWAVVVGVLACVMGSLSVAAPRARAGACATLRHYSVGFAAAADSALPADGGVLFVPTLANGRGEGNVFAPHGAAPLESLRRGSRALRSTREELAPGWVLLRPATPHRGRLTAHAGSAQRAFSMAREDGPSLAAPASPSLRYYPSQTVQTRRGRSTASAYNSLSLAQPPPAGAYAVIVRHAAAAGQAPRGDGFGVAIESPAQRTFTFSGDGGRCQPRAPGEVVSAGSDVTVFFVSANGQRSPDANVRVR